MKKNRLPLLLWLIFYVFLLSPLSALSDTPAGGLPSSSAKSQETSANEMLGSLIELQKNLAEEIEHSREKLAKSTSDAEKAALKEEISRLDKQLSETTYDFERIATGVEPALFLEKQPETFSWKEELGSLLEPAIKELKRFTVRARQKSDLKEKITELQLLSKTADEAVDNLQTVLAKAENNEVKNTIKPLLPEWQNIDKRLSSKLELAQRELAQLEAQEVSLVESSSKSMREFFRARGLYLALAVVAFTAILVGCRLLYRLIIALYFRVGMKRKKRSFQVRLLYIVFQVLSIVLAVLGLFFVLYLAEDWFLLSMAIIFFLGLAWTIRQAVPRLWQQGRLMLNVGAVREGERLILHGVPWKVASINVFCTLVNPTLDVTLRIPIEELIGLVSRPYHPEEPWFPCRKGDWVVVNGGSRARVISQSHEQVELVERGGRRIFYPTETFLQACPANLSRNFRLRVPFGLSYNLQAEMTSTIPAMVKEHLATRMEDEGYSEKCLNLQVEFQQAGGSSLDLLVLADFDGSVADIQARLERAIQKWCVECCTLHDWEIPFPQLTVHKA